MKKYIQHYIKNIKTFFYTLVGVNYENSDDYKIYLNHMENTGTNPNTAWKKLWSSIKHPMVVVPLLGATISLLVAYFGLDQTDTFFKSILQLLSAMMIGISTNHFTSLFKEQSEYQVLKFKAEQSVRKTNTVIKTILRKDVLDNLDLCVIDNLIDEIDVWKEYYPKVDTSKLQQLTALKVKADNEYNEPQKLEIKQNISLLESDLAVGATSSFISLSANTFYQETILKTKNN